MPDFTITKVRNAGEKDNPHGGKLVKWYIGLQGAPSGEEDVYVQKKPGNDLSPGMEISGRLEKGEYGWRLFPEPQGGNFKAPSYPVPTLERQDDRGARIERQSARRDAISYAAIVAEFGNDAPSLEQVKTWTDQLDADVGSSQVAHGASEQRPSVDEDAADLSAEADVGGGGPTAENPAAADVSPEEASSQQKSRLTQDFHKAGLSRDAMKAVVMWRCGQEKATKQGASQLITDLQEGATHDALLAEIWDAKRAGNPLGARAAALIPTEMPWEDDGSLPEAPTTDDAGVPF